MPHVIDMPRQRDDQVLLWLALRKDGLSVNEIARGAGEDSGTVASATNAVREADLRESAEAMRDVLRHYW